MSQRSTHAAVPTPEQEFLLRAALLSGSAGLDAWKQWRASVDFESLDAGSQRLLPLLYMNLQRQLIDDPLMGRLKGFYRLTWYKNQALFHEIEALLCALHEAGIRTMLLRGAALALLYYQNYGLRPMSDFDVAVPEQDVHRVITVLQKVGWQHKGGRTGASLEHMAAAHHATPFCKDTSELNLHSPISFPSWRCALPNDWKQAVPVQLNGTETLAMHPADMLIHICVHGVAWNPIPPLLWVADAAALLRAEPTLDWAYVVTQAKAARLALPVYTALQYLRGLLDLDIPVSVLLELEQTPVSRQERFRMKQAVLPRSPVKNALFHYDSYTNLRESQHAPPSLTGFLRYLQDAWGVEHMWHTPFHGMKRAGRFLRGTTP
jgi:hypothetical protein